MSNEQAKALGKTLWGIADVLRGSMDADQFRDYMLGFIFFKYLSDNYRAVAEKNIAEDGKTLEEAYTDPKYTAILEKVIKDAIGYTLQPRYLWDHFVKFSKDEKNPLQPTEEDLKNKVRPKEIMEELRDAFQIIESSTVGGGSESDISGLFGEIDLNSQKLGTSAAEKSKMLYRIIKALDEGLAKHSIEEDELGDAYEYLIGQFAANSGKKAGEFYTPRQVSSILARIVALDSQNPKLGPKKSIEKIYDPACGSGSLLFNVYHTLGGKVGAIHGQEKNLTTYNLARMNLLLHHIPHEKFHIANGDTLTNPEANKASRFDAIVANPPFSLKWDPAEMDAQGDDRFRGYGVPPQSAADYAFILHMLFHLKDNGTLAVVVPHGVLFRGGSEGRIRQALIEQGYLDAVIGLPSNLFYSTGIPVCILVLKKCSRSRDVLFIDASKGFEKGKKQNVLTEEHIERIVDTYRYRKVADKFSAVVSLEALGAEDYNLNIPRYVSTAEAEEPLDIAAIVSQIQAIQAEEASLDAALEAACKELGVPFWG